MASAEFEINLKKILLACIPTLVIGFIFYKLFKQFLVGNMIIIAWALIIGAIMMFMASYVLEKTKEKKLSIKHKDAILFGVAQAVAIIPGVSRSGAVLIAGYFSGFEKNIITRFSFLIGLPVAYMAALYDIYKTPTYFSNGEVVQLVLGIVVSGIVAYIAAAFFLRYIQKIKLNYFAWYRIGLGLIILLFI